jgi:hypothetical protein
MFDSGSNYPPYRKYVHEYDHSLIAEWTEP